MSVEVPMNGVTEGRVTHAAKGLRRGLLRVLALGGLVGLAAGSVGCIEDTDCGICDPDNLILESISGINYASRKIHLVNPTCEGDKCPAPFTKGSYFVNTIGPCEDTDDARNSPRGAEEYCKLSPLVSAFGVEFVFNNLLEATSVELVRKRPDNPQLYEVYDWKTQIADIEGPISRYNGDYYKGSSRTDPDLITRLVNLSCIDNLNDQGIPFSHEDYADPATNPCNALDPATGRPRKMRQSAKLSSYRGIWTAGSNSCSSPQEGPNTCCTQCDFLLSTKVARYGVTQSGERRTPNYTGFPLGPCTVDVDGNDDCPSGQTCEVAEGETSGLCQGPLPAADAAIACDSANGDPLVQCRDFIPSVDRSLEERTYDFFWSNPPGPNVERDRGFTLPYYDLLRETHPDARPEWLENRTARCTSSGQCTSATGHNLPGTQCIGELNGQACLMDRTPGCEQGVCRPQWFVTCESNPDTTGSTGFCVDRRFAQRSTAGCFESDAQFWGLCDDEQDAEYGLSRCAGRHNGDRPLSIAFCDGNENSLISAGECCQPALQSGEYVQQCDPFSQENVRPIARYKRDENLPRTARSCVCQANPPDECAQVVAAACTDGDGNIKPEREGEYAVKFVSRRGGIIYDPAIKGIEFRPAHLGGVPRGAIESCAEQRNLVARRNRHDGWRSNDAFTPHAYEDYDRAMCSDSEYRVVFAAPDGSNEAIEYLRDKVGNTLGGKSVYTFRTPHFHVVPNSGFPTDNLRIGACDAFQLRFSNKYDISPENLQKLQIFRVENVGPPGEPRWEPTTPNDQCPDVVPVAGGPFCVETDIEKDNDPCRPPCLVVDVSSHFLGEVKVRVDNSEFAPAFEVDNRYRFVVPGLGSPADMNDPSAYQAAFWDACGMPLITGGGGNDFIYEFSIDEPRCKEDLDRDDIPRGCDNAPLHFNPFQEDIDFDGFGDVIDKCPTVATSTNTADSDNDGVGNQCDNCRQTTNQYNRHVAALGIVPAYMYVRNIPYQTDTDGDGIGDVCDNCVVVANCENFSHENPWSPGDAIAFDDYNLCQRDDNADMVGDVCEGMINTATTHMPVGLNPDDDFDQDGIRNLDDACPRQPLEDRIECTVDSECPEFRTCEIFCLPEDDPNFDPDCDPTVGLCNHSDVDGDGVGDICDNCPYDENRGQILEGMMQEDDPDGDFVGSACETHARCAQRIVDPRPFSFYEVAVNNMCCTVQLIEGPSGELVNAVTGNPLTDPCGRPITIDCQEDQDSLDPFCADQEQGRGLCRRLPSRVAERPGVVVLPPGCEEALDGQENQKITPAMVNQDLDAFWAHQCFLPQWDQDYDGLGDLCDLCPFDFDPENRAFVDDNGRTHPSNGWYCSGTFDAENAPWCTQDDVEDTEGETEGDDMGGTGTGGDDDGPEEPGE
jgi:hypothetical protein